VAEQIVASTATSPEMVKSYVEGFAAAGCDELIFGPGAASLDQFPRIRTHARHPLLHLRQIVARLAFLAPEGRRSPVQGDLDGPGLPFPVRLDGPDLRRLPRREMHVRLVFQHELEVRRRMREDRRDSACGRKARTG